MLFETRLGSWLALIRVQSTPVSVLPPLLGFGTVARTLLTVELLPLIVSVGLGHWGIYAINDYYDRDVDSAAGKTHKPLVAGDISPEAAYIAAVGMMTVSVVYMFLVAPVLSALAYGVSVLIGLIYNWTAKESMYAGVYLGIWGIVMVYTGAMFAGVPGVYTALIALLIGVHMVWMTAEGSLKDITEMEACVPRVLGCRSMPIDTDVTEYPYVLIITRRFRLFVHSMLLLHLFLVAVVIIYDGIMTVGVRGEYILLITVIAVLFYLTGYSVATGGNFSEPLIKRRIVLHTVAVTLLICISTAVFIPPIDILIVVSLAILWGIGWQTIQYGSPLYFP